MARRVLGEPIGRSISERTNERMQERMRGGGRARTRFIRTAQIHEIASHAITVHGQSVGCENEGLSCVAEPADSRVLREGEERDSPSPPSLPRYGGRRAGGRSVGRTREGERAHRRERDPKVIASAGCPVASLALSLSLSSRRNAHDPRRERRGGGTGGGAKGATVGAGYLAMRDQFSRILFHRRRDTPDAAAVAASSGITRST